MANSSDTAANSYDTTDNSSGFVIDAVFSLADDISKTISWNDTETPSSSNQTDTTISRDSYEKLLNSSPVPMKHCSVRVNNFIEKDIRNKLTEACNNAIVKQEPGLEKAQETNDVSNNCSDKLPGRPSRKRKPNSLLSSDYLYKTEEIRQFQKDKKKKNIPEVNCEIDRDLVMSVAEKCLPEIVEKSENKEDIKMVSILPPTLKININDTPVIVDWKKKVAHPIADIEEIRYTRPQTAKTKKKLRTQEQIDRENAEKCKISKPKSKPRPKSKKRKMLDPSPPHLEPYGGDIMDTSSNMQTPRSPDGLPPQLKPYEIHVNNNKEVQVQSPSLNMSGSIKPKESKKSARRDRSETDSGLLSQDIIPCSLTGRMRKPNQQFGSDYLLGFAKSSPKTTTKNNPATVSEKLPETNTTLNHENNTVQVTMLPNSSKHTNISSSTISNILNSASQFAGQGTTPKNISPGGASAFPSASIASQSNTTNTKLTSAIGELAKMENTKKFFQLIVGDKVVLIPTNGDSVVPKAFVMDIAATRPGSYIGQSKTTSTTTSILGSNNTQNKTTTATVSPGRKTFLMTLPSNSSTSTGGQSKPAQAIQTKLITSQPKPVQGSSNISIKPKMPAQNTSLQTQQAVQRMPMTTTAVTSVTSATSAHITNVSGTRYVTVQAPFASVGQKIILPLVTSSGTLPGTPYPTNIVTNTAGTLKNSQTSLLQSVHTYPNTQNTSADTDCHGPVVKKEPDNIKDYEKAVKSFKGVPDTESDTESDEETKSAQAQRQSSKVNVNVPEVGSHVPASESETGERIRKLKEKLREQQLQLENMRKNMVSNERNETTHSDN